MRVVVQPCARQDLTEIAVYLGQRNTGAATRFSRAVAATLRTLCRFPQMGGLQEFPNPALEGIRAWPVRRFRNYLIFYRIDPDSIQVIRVLHGARDVESVLGTG